MKNIKILISNIFLLAFIFYGCENPETVKEPNFEVTPVSLSATVGEPVEFMVKNAPDFLMFYSGELGHQYKFRERTKAEGIVSMSFKNAQKFGLGTNATGTLSVLASSDYDGSSSAEGVNNATWTDITDRFNIATAYDFAWTESGSADVTDLADGEPIYFAFKFFSEDIKSDGNRQPEWRIGDFNIQLDSDDAAAPLQVATLFDPGFNSVDIQGIDEAWNVGKWYYDTGRNIWRFRGGPTDYPNEDWLISNAINLTGVAPDKGEPLKTYSTPLESFTHTYAEPGTYIVTFVGNNTTIHGDKTDRKSVV